MAPRREDSRKRTAGTNDVAQSHAPTSRYPPGLRHGPASFPVNSRSSTRTDGVWYSI